MNDSQTRTAFSRRTEPEIVTYAYPEMPWPEDSHRWSQAFGRDTLHEKPPAAAGESAKEAANGEAAGLSAGQRSELDAQWLARLGEEVRQASEKGRREGFELGLQRGREDSSSALREERERLLQQGAELTSSFAEERSRYFHQAEEELVRLALAIAARILRREAQMDPLLLTGAVRVALGQLAQSTSVRLHVPEADRPLWEEAFARLPNLAQRPEVVGEAEMELGECRIETELGSADLSLWAQLKEIERGFFDRVGARGLAEEPESREASSAHASARPPASSSAAGSSSRSAAAAAAEKPSLASLRPDALAADRSPVEEGALASAYYNEREW